MDRGPAPQGKQGIGEDWVPKQRPAQRSVITEMPSSARPRRGEAVEHGHDPANLIEDGMTTDRQQSLKHLIEALTIFGPNIEEKHAPMAKHR